MRTFSFLRRLRLWLCLLPMAAAAPAGAEFADSLSGGPDYWQVTGVLQGDVLNIRRAPSAKAAVVVAVANGAALRNKGCRIVSRQRWCKVETVAGTTATGWAAGRYLREGPAPSATGGGFPPGLDLPAACRRFGAIDLATQPSKIRTAAVRPGPEGYLVDATADLGRQGIKLFACRFDKAGTFYGVMPRIGEGGL